MRNSTLTCLCVTVLAIASASAADPSSDKTSTTSSSANVVSVQDQPWDSYSGQPAGHLGAARDSFVAVDMQAAADSLRKAAANLREASREAAVNSRQSLNASADELESLGKRIETRMVHRVEELDSAMARAYHSVAEHQFRVGQRLWTNREHRQAGWRIRAAADNLERAAATTNQRASAATQTAIKDSRILASRMVQGTGYAVDEVGKTFEALGKQVETFGGGISKTAQRPASDSGSK
jgi:hypothetical protein